MSEPGSGSEGIKSSANPGSENLGAGSALRALVFCLSLAVMIGVIAWPHLLGATQAQFSHNAAMLLLMGMSCGFVYGIGFVPHLRLWRWLFSAPVALGLMLWGGLLICT